MRVILPGSQWEVEGLVASTSGPKSGPRSGSDVVLNLWAVGTVMPSHVRFPVLKLMSTPRAVNISQPMMASHLLSVWLATKKLQGTILESQKLARTTGILALPLVLKVPPRMSILSAVQVDISTWEGSFLALMMEPDLP